MWCRSTAADADLARVQVQETNNTWQPTPFRRGERVEKDLELEPGASKDTALEQALAIENVQRHIGDKEVRKVIHVPDRLLNIVVG